MQEKERLIRELDEARDQMRAAAGMIDQDREIYSNWTIKHVLAHITGWDDAVIASLRAHAGGKEPGVPAQRGIDYYNEQTVSTRETLDYPLVFREWEQTRETLKRVIREIPDDKFGEMLTTPWGARGTVTELVRVFAEHEYEHAGEIEALLDGDP